jgi:hypothetical protein
MPSRYCNVGVPPSKEELRERLASRVEALRQQRHAEERAARTAASKEFHVCLLISLIFCRRQKLNSGPCRRGSGLGVARTARARLEQPSAPLLSGLTYACLSVHTVVWHVAHANRVILPRLVSVGVIPSLDARRTARSTGSGRRGPQRGRSPLYSRQMVHSSHRQAAR